MVATSVDNRAARADSFGSILAIAATRATLSIWMEEHLRLFIAAGTFVLPLPNLCDWLR
jgi:hypothetical protein